MKKLTYTLYAMYEYDKKGEYTNKEFFSSEKERDERVLIRKRFARPFGIEEEVLILPKDVWKLGETKDFTKSEVKEIQAENKKLNNLLKEVKSIVYKLNNKI